MKKTKKIVYLLVALLLSTSSVSSAAGFTYRVIGNSPSNRYNSNNCGNFKYESIWNIISNYNKKPDHGMIVTPVKPAPTPTEPVQPTEPNKPVEPTKPADPAEPTDPVEPTKPPVEPNKPNEPTNPTETTPTQSLSADEAEVVRLVKIEREKTGLAPLKSSSKLSNVAREKSKDMATKNYFSHTSPTYGSPFDMMKQFGITYRTAGENIAKGYLSPQSVMNGWMNSTGHRENILNPSFGTIGVGAYKVGNTVYWTQMFTN